MLLTFEKKSRFSRKWQIFGATAAVIVAFVAFKTTLAASISLNSGISVEYGQGISQATACSGGSNITVTPADSFTNASGSGSFYFNAFTVSGVPSGCYGFDFLINAFDNSNNDPLALFNTTSTTATVWDNAGTFTVGAGMTGATVTSISTSSFRVNFTVPVLSSGTVYKLGIQSGSHSPSTCAQGATCAIGDTGPGGGIVYYVNLSGFTETGASCSTHCHYLEWAPSGWYQNQSNPTFTWVSDTTHQALASLNSVADGTGNEAIGAGFANTAAMLTTNGSYTADTSGIAYAANAYAGTDSSAGQWFIPSYSELSQIYTSGTAALSYSGGFQPFVFWSSSEKSATYAWWISVYNNSGGSGAKTGTWNARPVRAF